MRLREHVVTAACLLLLAVISFHFYRKPIYDMDMVGYLGNALLMKESDVVKVHDQVYAEMRRTLPPEAFVALTGQGGPPDQNASRQARFEHAGNFAEFLPFFAIRPLYNMSVYFLGRIVGLIAAVRLISALSYFLMGVLTFLWMSAYIPKHLGAAMTLLLMLTTPLTWIGRYTGSDALATLAAFFGLYLVFERGRFAVGVALLMISLWIRTDNIVVLAPVVVWWWMRGRVEFWKAAVLGALAVASVLAINHFAGDYGIKMLYYRNFVGVPIAPGEMSVQFSVREYLSAFAGGIRAMLASYTTLFMLLGVSGWWLSRKARPVISVAAISVAVHFLILPNWQERWFGVFYLTMGIALAAALGERFSVVESRRLVVAHPEQYQQDQAS